MKDSKKNKYYEIETYNDLLNFEPIISEPEERLLLNGVFFIKENLHREKMKQALEQPTDSKALEAVQEFKEYICANTNEVDYALGLLNIIEKALGYSVKVVK